MDDDPGMLQMVPQHSTQYPCLNQTIGHASCSGLWNVRNQHKLQRMEIDPLWKGPVGMCGNQICRSAAMLSQRVGTLNNRLSIAK